MLCTEIPEGNVATVKENVIHALRKFFVEQAVTAGIFSSEEEYNELKYRIETRAPQSGHSPEGIDQAAWENKLAVAREEHGRANSLAKAAITRKSLLDVIKEYIGFLQSHIPFQEILNKKLEAILISAFRETRIASEPGTIQKRTARSELQSPIAIILFDSRKGLQKAKHILTDQLVEVVTDKIAESRFESKAECLYYFDLVLKKNMPRQIKTKKPMPYTDDLAGETVDLQSLDNPITEAAEPEERNIIEQSDKYQLVERLAAGIQYIDGPKVNDWRTLDTAIAEYLQSLEIIIGTDPASIEKELESEIKKALSPAEKEPQPDHREAVYVREGNVYTVKNFTKRQR